LLWLFFEMESHELFSWIGLEPTILFWLLQTTCFVAYERNRMSGMTLHLKVSEWCLSNLLFEVTVKCRKEQELHFLFFFLWYCVMNWRHHAY
jgi:hypothetical protein